MRSAEFLVFIKQLLNFLSPVAQLVNNLPVNVEDTDSASIPGLGRSPGEGNGNPLQYSCLENSMEKRSLAGYSPWGHKESNMTMHTHTHTHTHTHFPLPFSVYERIFLDEPLRAREDGAFMHTYFLN